MALKSILSIECRCLRDKKRWPMPFEADATQRCRAACACMRPDDLHTHM